MCPTPGKTLSDIYDLGQGSPSSTIKNRLIFHSEGDVLHVVKFSAVSCTYLKCQDYPPVVAPQNISRQAKFPHPHISPLRVTDLKYQKNKTLKLFDTILRETDNGHEIFLN
jgi:hypothetical protein